MTGTISLRMGRLLTKVEQQFTAPTLGRYLNDPAYRGRLDAERDERQAAIAAELDAPLRARQEAIWASDPEPDLGEPMRNGGLA